MSEKPPFWLVWNPLGRIPQFRHQTQKLAEEEARRLANENPGSTFYVLAPVCEIIKQPVTVRRFELDEIPF